MRTTAHRHGAALILVMVTLVALMLLGLPFLFSQSSSLAGAQSLAWSQRAHLGRTSSENLAVALGAHAMRDYLAAEATSHAGWTALASTLSASFAAVGATTSVVRGEVDGRLAIDLQELTKAAFVPDQANERLGLQIQDDSTRLDPNALSAAGWNALLKRVGIQDWDDNEVVHSYYISGGNNTFSRYDDGDAYGQLANALADLRQAMPGALQRLTSLDDLLKANPGHNTDDTNTSSLQYNDDNLTGTQYASKVGVKSFGFRRQLTRAELELLRPYLTLSQPPTGRNGLIDLGTVVFASGTSAYIDGPAPYINALNGSLPLDIARDSTRLVVTPTVNAAPSTWKRPRGEQVRNGTQVTTDDLVAIEAPPIVNLNGAPAPVLAAVGVAALGPLATTRNDLHTAQGSPAPANPVVPGNNNATGIGQAFTAFSAQNPVVSGAERPAAGVVSTGMLAVESTARVSDARHRQASQDQRAVTVQAIPQEEVLEQRWTNQGEMNQLIAQRWGSRVEAWPNPFRRMQWDNNQPRSKPDEPAPGGTTEPGTSIRPETMPSLATGFQSANPSHLRVPFKATFGGDAVRTLQAPGWPTVLNGSGTATPPALMTGITRDSLYPDGLRITAADRFAYRLAADISENQVLKAVGAGAPEMASQHVSLWVQPQSNWTSGLIPIWEARMTDPNAPLIGKQWTGTAGEPARQNYLGLWFDADKSRIVLVLAPPTVIQDVDGGIKSGNSSLPLLCLLDAAITPLIDERCLGGGTPLAPKIPSGISAVSALLKANMVATVYQVAPGYFKAKRWIHLQTVIGNDRPGGNAIIIDGIVGRDLIHVSGGDFQVMGDHCTLPALPLATALPLVAATGGIAGTLNQPGTITVTKIAGLNASDLFPARGTLRIGDEHILYASLSVNTFSGCVRGQRQNTQVDIIDADKRRPLLQGHALGSLVMPSGVRLTSFTPGSQLYRGGCTLAHDFGPGDQQYITPTTTINPLPTYIWSRLDPMVDVTTTDGNTKTLPLLSSILPITRLTLTSGIGNGVPTQFPPRGIVRIGGNYLYYSSISGLTLNGVVNLRDQIAMIRPTGFAYPLARSDVSWSTNSLPPPVILLSIEAAGADALEMAGAQTIRYKTTPLGDTAASEYQGTVPDANNQSPERKYFLLQLLDPTTGKCEWLNYAEILRTINSGPQFFLSRAGWMYTPRVNNLVGIRGAQRTETPGRQGSLTAGQTFPANTLLIPVQTELGSEAHLLATGDVITLMPNDLSSGLTSQQAVVRYAAMDGYGDGNLQDSSDSDTKNEFFAFSSALPDSTPPLASQVQILKWPCWNGIDLTPMTSVITKAGILPRLDGFGANGRFLIGNIDPDTSSGPTTSPQEMTIDALVSGPLSNVSLTDSSNASGLSIRNVFDPFGTPTGSGLPVGGFIESAGIIGSPGYKILRETTNDKPALGLLLINGESVVVGPITTADAQLIQNSATASVTAPYGNVATIQSSGSFAKIIARGVLDPQRTTPTHSWSTGPVRAQDNKELRPLIPALLLPIGPIVQVHGSMTDGQWYQVTDGWENASGSPTRPRFDAPAALWLPLGGNTPAAAAPEIIAMTAQRTRRIFDPNLNPPGFRDDGTELLTAEWQRRLYNTTLGSIADKDLLIGWWPRYPSALPKDSSGPELERMRSRTYAWVGFPLGMWRMRFDKALLTGVAGQRNALATILNTDSDDLFTFEFRTLTTGFNWLSAGVLDGVDSGTDIDLSDAWSNIPANTEWDGAEMRAHWRYAVDAASADVTSNLAAVANAANRAPALGPVRIRFRAPALILGVEAGR